jgi:hypothetical protein
VQKQRKPKPRNSGTGAWCLVLNLKARREVQKVLKPRPLLKCKAFSEVVLIIGRYTRIELINDKIKRNTNKKKEKKLLRSKHSNTFRINLNDTVVSVYFIIIFNIYSINKLTIHNIIA